MTARLNSSQAGQTEIRNNTLPAITVSTLRVPPYSNLSDFTLEAASVRLSP